MMIFKKINLTYTKTSHVIKNLVIIECVMKEFRSMQKSCARIMNTIYYNNSNRSFDMMNAGDIETLVKIKESSKKKLIVALNIGNEKCVNNFRERLFSLVCCTAVDGVIINPTNQNSLKLIEITNDDCVINRVFGYLTPRLIKERIISSKEVYEARNKKKLESC